MEIKTKFNLDDRIECVPMQGAYGRILEIVITHGGPLYKIEHYSNYEQKNCWLKEDDIMPIKKSGDVGLGL